MNKPDDLKLVYVLKIGYNSKGEGLYEFIFSKNIENILSMTEDWNWDQSPANSPDNAVPPTEEYIDKICPLKTDKFDLWCLHEANDRSYMDGVYTIHCLAYETEKENNEWDYEDMYEQDDDSALLVFHYGMTIEQVESILYDKDIILHNNEFKQSNNIEIDE